MPRAPVVQVSQVQFFQLRWPRQSRPLRALRVAQMQRAQAVGQRDEELGAAAQLEMLKVWQVT